MAIGIDIFDNPTFSIAELTLAANNIPPVMGQVGSTIDFEEDGVRTTTVTIEATDGSLSLVEPSGRGGPGEVISHDKRGIRKFDTAHFQRDESVFAEEVQNIRAFGSTTELMQVEQIVQSKLGRHYRDFDLTAEWLKFGVLCGNVTSGKGVSILNIYQEFGIAAPANVMFDLATAGTKVRLLSDNLRSSMEDDIVAPAYGSIVAFCGNDFFRALVDHKEVRDTYLNTAAAAELRGSLPDVFSYGGIEWHRYRTTAKAKAAHGGTPFLADDEARVCFKGVPGLYLTRYAPADYWDTVNMPGLPIYARENKKERTDKSVSFQIQRNPLHVCTQPKTLRRLKLGAPA